MGTQRNRWQKTGDNRRINARDPGGKLTSTVKGIKGKDKKNYQSNNTKGK